MEDLTRTSFPGIGCFFYRGSKSNGAGGERCFHEVQECRRFRGVVGAAWMGSRSSNGDPQLSNFDNETFGMEPFFHRTSANRVSNFDRRRATWPWLFVFGDFPAFSKGGSLDFSRPNPLPTIVRTYWIGEREVFFGGSIGSIESIWTHYGTRKFRNLSSPMEIFPFETFFLMRIFQFHYTPLSLLQLSCNRSLSRNFNNFIFQFKILDYYRWLKNRDNSW